MGVGEGEDEDEVGQRGQWENKDGNNIAILLYDNGRMSADRNQRQV